MPAMLATMGAGPGPVIHFVNVFSALRLSMLPSAATTPEPSGRAP